MSYLNLATGIPEFSKAVISLWFRVPKETMEAVIAEVLEPAFTFILPFTVPLITFGQKKTKKRYQPNYENVAHAAGGWPGTPTPILDSPTYSIEAEDPVNPSYIGVACQSSSEGEEKSIGFLEFNIQMKDFADIAQEVANRTHVDVYSDFVDPSPPAGYSSEPGSGWSDGGFFFTHFTNITDNSYIKNAQPEYFYVKTIHEIEPDVWHHLLLSFDITGTCSSGYPFPVTDCKLWYAIDDVDYRGSDNLQPFRDADDLIDDNGIVTENCYQISGGDGSVGITPGNCFFGPATCTFIPSPIPSFKEALGIPASVDYVDHIHHVEMAEFQMFIGDTLDTGEEKNRRAFIDFARDEKGKIIKDKDGKATLVPVPPPAAEKLLGKKPEVMLHGSSKWIKGENTGTIGMDYSSDPPKIKSEGQFRPFAEIKAYKPDPSLKKDAP